MEDTKVYWEEKFKGKGEVWGTQPSKAAILLVEDLHNYGNAYKNGKVIDIGCGYGRDMNYLYECGYKNLLGIDFSEEAVKLGQKAYPALHILNTDIFEYDFSEKANIIFCNFIIHLLTDEDKRKLLINRLYENLEDNGLLYAAVSSDDDSEFKNGDVLGYNLVRNKRGVVKFYYNQQLIMKEFGGGAVIQYTAFEEEHTHDYNHTHINFLIKCCKQKEEMTK